MLIGTCQLGFEKILNYIITLSVFDNKYEVTQNGETQSFSNFDNVQNILKQRLFDKEMLHEMHPNRLYINYFNNDSLLRTISIEIFNKRNSSDSSLNDFCTTASKSISSLESNLKFFIQYHNSTFQGWYINHYCPKCHYPFFYDEHYDALLCFRCDEWIEEPGLCGEDNRLSKPSERRKQPVQNIEFSQNISPCSFLLHVDYPNKGRTSRQIKISANLDSTLLLNGRPVDSFDNLLEEISSIIYAKGIKKLKKVSLQSIEPVKSMAHLPLIKENLFFWIEKFMIEQLNDAGIWIPFRR